MMKYLRSIVLLLPVVLFPGSPMMAQQTHAIDMKDTVKVQKILKTYEGWMRMKNDWPDFARYREANALLAPPAKGENRVVFMGNSITDAWIRYSPEFFKKNHYIDRGISGQTTPQMLVRFRADVIKLQPKAVVILAGTNDLAGNTGPSTLEMIEDNLASMAELADYHHIRVILCSVLPVYDYPWRPGTYPAEKIKRINRWMQQYANDHGHLYLDYYSSLVDDRGGMRAEYSEDGVHPNKAGYGVMEERVQEAIRKALKK